MARQAKEIRSYDKICRLVFTNRTLLPLLEQLCSTPLWPQSSLPDSYLHITVPSLSILPSPDSCTDIISDTVLIWISSISTPPPLTFSISPCFSSNLSGPYWSLCLGR